MAQHHEINPDPTLASLHVAHKALQLAQSEHTKPAGSIYIPNGDGTGTLIGAASGTDTTGHPHGAVEWVGDTTAPGKPLGITAESHNGVLTIHWNGQLEGGTPADYAHTTLYAKTGNQPALAAGTLTAAGETHVTGLEAGTTVDCWAVAYDNAHDIHGNPAPNASEESDHTQVTITDPVANLEQRADHSEQQAGQLAGKLEQVREDASKGIQTAKDAATKAQETAEQVRADTTASISSVRQTANNAAQNAAAANTKADTLAQNLDAANTIITRHDTQLGELKTTVTNTTTTAQSALAVASQAVQDANGIKITADKAYNDAQNALTQSAQAQLAADRISLDLSQNYLDKTGGDALYATQTQLNATSERISASVAQTYATKTALNELQNIADNAIETWTGTTKPTTNNAPANTWTTSQLKNQHAGDIYYDTTSGYSYRWNQTAGTWQWTLIKDTDITKALADAAAAQTSAQQAQAGVDAIRVDLPATYTSKTEFTQTADELALKAETAAKTGQAALDKTAQLQIASDNISQTVSEHAATITGNTTSISKLQQTATSLSVDITQVSNRVNGNVLDIANPGYETGDMTGWTAEGWTSSNVSSADGQWVHSGKYRFIAYFPAETSTVMPTLVSRDFPVIPGHVYQVSVYSSTNTSSTVPVTFGLESKNKATRMAATENEAANQAWRLFTIDVTIPSNISVAHAYLSTTAKNSANCLRVDDWSVRDITEGSNALTQTSKLEQNLNGFKTTVSQTYTSKTEFDNLKIGGRNILQESGDFTELKLWKKQTPSDQFGLTTEDSYKVIGCPGGGIVQEASAYRLEFDQDYVYHAMMKFETAGTLTSMSPMHFWCTTTAGLNYVGGGQGGLTVKDFYAEGHGKNVPANTWVHLVCKFHTVTKPAEPSDQKYLHFRPFVWGGSLVNNGWYWLRWIKLEEGTRPTDWTPAPEDMVSQTEAQTTYTSKTEFAQEKDRITLSVSEAASTATTALNKANTLEQTSSRLTSTIQEHAATITGQASSISKLEQTAASLSSTITRVGNTADVALLQADDYIIDGGFENGQLTWPGVQAQGNGVNPGGWRFADNTYKSGKTCLVHDAGNGDRVMLGLIHQPGACIGEPALRVLSVIPGRRYRLTGYIQRSGDYQCSRADNDKIRLGVENGGVIWDKQYSTLPANTWTKVAYDFTPSATQTRITLALWSTATRGYVAFDDFTFRDVTEAADAHSVADDAITRYSAIKQDLDGFKTETGQKYETKTDALAKKSALESTINAFKTEVSTTYATKNNVDSLAGKLDNLTVGGRNLAVYGQLGNFSSTSFTYDRATNTYTMVAPVGTSSWGYGARIKRNDTSVGRHNVVVPWGMTLIKSFDAYVPVDATISSDFDLYPVTGASWNSNDNDLGASRSPSRVAVKGGQWTKVWWSSRNADPRNTGKVDLVDNSNFGLVTSGFGEPVEWKIRNFKAELGTIPTDWTPAPEDMATASELLEQKTYIDQQDSKIELGVKNTYQTKSDMGAYAKTTDVDSKISASKDGIMLEVGRQYAEKTLPQELVDQLKLGATNILQRTQWLDRNGVSASDTGYLMSLPAAYDATDYLGKFKVGKVTAANNVACQYSVKNVQFDTDYVFSWYAKGASRITAYFYGPGSNGDYIGAKAVEASDGMTSISSAAFGNGDTRFQLSGEWKRYWVHWKIDSKFGRNGSSEKYVLLRDDTSVRDAMVAAPKLELGTKPSEWSPAPWDLADTVTVKEHGTKITQNTNEIALRAKTADVESKISQTAGQIRTEIAGQPSGDNLWPNQWCKPSTASAPQLVLGKTYDGTETAPLGGNIFQLGSRDMFNGSFKLRLPGRYRIIVDAKRVKGETRLAAGIWQREGNASSSWQHHTAVKTEDLTDGWQRLTYDFANTNKRVAALYFQIEQSGNSAQDGATVWLVSNIRFHEITDTDALATSLTQTKDQIALKADSAWVSSQISQTASQIRTEIADVNVGARNLMRAQWLTTYEPSTTTMATTDYVGEGRFTFSRTAVPNGGPYMDDYRAVQAGRDYIIHFRMRVTAGTVSNLYMHVGLNGTVNTTADTGLFVNGARRANGGQAASVTLEANTWYDIEYRYRTSASSVNKTQWNGHIFQPNKGVSTAYTIEVADFKWEQGTKPTDWTPAPEDMASANAMRSYVDQTRDSLQSYVGQQVDLLDFTGRNWLLDTAEQSSKTLPAASSGYTTWDFYTPAQPFKDIYAVNTCFGFSCDVTVKLPNPTTGSMLVKLGVNQSPWECFTTHTIPAGANGTVSYHVAKKIVNAALATTTATRMRCRVDNYPAGCTVTISNMKLETNGKPTGWTQAPEDTALGTRIVQTKDSVTTLITAADGKASAAQTAAANAQTTANRAQALGTQPPSLIVNGGFETGDLTGWTLENSTTGVNNTGAAHTGSYRVLLTPADTSTRSILRSADYAALAGHTYETAAWVYADDTNAIAIGMERAQVNVTPAAAGRYVRISARATASADGQQRVYIGKTLTAGKCLRIDDVSVTDVTDTVKTQAAAAQIGTIQTFIAQKPEGVLVGKNVNGTPSGLVSRVSSTGSFDILDYARGGAQVASFSGDGMSVTPLVSGNTSAGFEIGHRLLKTGSGHKVIADMRFPMGAAYMGYPATAGFAQIVRDTYQTPGAIYRADSNGFIYYDVLRDSADRPESDILIASNAQASATTIGNLIAGYVDGTGTGSYGGYSAEEWYAIMFSRGFMLSGHNDASKPEETGYGYKSVVLMAPGLYQVAGVLDLQAEPVPVRGDAWLMWNLSGSENGWSRIPNTPVLTPLWNGQTSVGGDQPNHWVRYTTPPILFETTRPCVRVAWRLPPNHCVGSRTMMSVTRLPFGYTPQPAATYYRGGIAQPLRTPLQMTR